MRSRLLFKMKHVPYTCLLMRRNELDEAQWTHPQLERSGDSNAHRESTFRTFSAVCNLIRNRSRHWPPFVFAVQRSLCRLDVAKATILCRNLIPFPPRTKTHRAQCATAKGFLHTHTPSRRRFMGQTPADSPACYRYILHQ